MRRYKVYLKSGTVITIQADEIEVGDPYLWLTLTNGGSTKLANGTIVENVVAQFAPGMWEGWQDVTPKTPEPKEKSGS